MRVVTFSDTHSSHIDVTLPPGDLLIFAGDFSGRGTMEDVVEFDRWLGTLDYKYKVIIAGNHDIAIEKVGKKIAKNFIKNAIYLQDESVSIGGINIYGTPYQPQFMDWSFNLPRKGKELQEKWNLIPENTDILITHGPPYGVLDLVYEGGKKISQGCELLIDAVNRVRPSFHVFGHIHGEYGIFKSHRTAYINCSVRRNLHRTTYINCSVMNENYDIVNEPIIFDI